MTTGSGDVSTYVLVRTSAKRSLGGAGLRHFPSSCSHHIRKTQNRQSRHVHLLTNFQRVSVIESPPDQPTWFDPNPGRRSTSQMSYRSSSSSAALPPDPNCPVRCARTRRGNRSRGQRSSGHQEAGRHQNDDSEPVSVEVAHNCRGNEQYEVWCSNSCLQGSR